MKKYEITPAHQIELERIRDKYIANARRTDAMTDYDKSQMRIAMRGLYSNANLAYPGDSKIIFVESPLIAQFASGMAMALLSEQASEQSAWQAARQAAEQAAEQAEQAAGQAARQAAEQARQAAEQAEQAAWQAAWQAEQAAGQAARQAARQAEQAAWQAAWQAAEQAAWQAAWQAAEQAAGQAGQAAEQAAGQAGQAAEQAEQAADKKNSIDLYLMSFVSKTNKYGNFALFSAVYCWWYGSRSSLLPYYHIYGEFFKDVAKLRGKWDKWTPLNLDSLHGGIRYMTPDFTIISNRPELLKIDENGMLHSENSCAIKWRDGMEQFYWRGISIPDRWITDKSSLDAKTALTWPNIEQRRAACEILGWDTILNELTARTIDHDPNPEHGTLYEVDLPDSPKERFLRVKCATGRNFALRIDPKAKTVLEAQCWVKYRHFDTSKFNYPEITA